MITTIFALNFIIRQELFFGLNLGAMVMELRVPVPALIIE